MRKNASAKTILKEVRRCVEKNDMDFYSISTDVENEVCCPRGLIAGIMGENRRIFEAPLDKNACKALEALDKVGMDLGAIPSNDAPGDYAEGYARKIYNKRNKNKLSLAFIDKAIELV